MRKNDKLVQKRDEFKAKAIDHERSMRKHEDHILKLEAQHNNELQSLKTIVVEHEEELDQLVADKKDLQALQSENKRLRHTPGKQVESQKLAQSLLAIPEVASRIAEPTPSQQKIRARARH